MPIVIVAGTGGDYGQGVMVNTINDVTALWVTGETYSSTLLGVATNGGATPNGNIDAAVILLSTDGVVQTVQMSGNNGQILPTAIAWDSFHSSATVVGYTYCATFDGKPNAGGSANTCGACCFSFRSVLFLIFSPCAVCLRIDIYVSDLPACSSTSTWGTSYCTTTCSSDAIAARACDGM